MAKFTKSLFFPVKDKALARKISIESPRAFKASIKKVSVNGITLKEKKALTLAKTRAKVQLRRPNLSFKERKQFFAIANMKLPKVNVR